MNKPRIFLAMLLIFGFVFAQNDLTADIKIPVALAAVIFLLCNILPIVIMLAIVIAALLYAVGQFGSAESRAKFHGWATNIVIGAITALIVLLITPYFLGMLLGGQEYIMKYVSCGGDFSTDYSSYI